MITEPLALSTSQIYTILMFLISILVGIAMVSVHYRREYEELKVRNNKLKELFNKHLELTEGIINGD